MDEQDIELLKTLIDTQNITKTAKKLYTTQSSLTKRIQKMEQDLGCQLLSVPAKAFSLHPLLRGSSRKLKRSPSPWNTYGPMPFRSRGDLRFFKDRCFC